MSSSPRYLERDLFELGDSNHKLLERAHSFWFWNDWDEQRAQEESREPPLVVRNLVLNMCLALQTLAENGLGEDVQQFAQEAESCLSAAWETYQELWWAPQHLELVRGIQLADEGISAAAEERLSPLATAKWKAYREAFRKLCAAMPDQLGKWVELGTLVAQVLALTENEQPKILGVKFPVPALQRMLRIIRDTDAKFSDLAVELSNPRTNLLGYPNLDRVKRQVESIRRELLDRLARAETPVGTLNLPNAPSMNEKASTSQVRRPQRREIEVYRLRFALQIQMGKTYTQKQLAERYAEQKKCPPPSQGTISRWVRHVQAWLDNGNILPDFPKSTSKPQSVDPNVLEMGAREDHRTLRQRGKKVDDEDS